MTTRRRTHTAKQGETPTLDASDPRSVVDPSVPIARPDPSKPYPEENPIYVPPGEGGGEVPAPTLVSLNPATAALGDANFTLTVNGSGFTPESVIVWNGGDEPTTVVSDTQATTEVDMTTATVAMPIPVLVRNSGGDSNSISFDITDPVAGGLSRRHSR